MWSALRKLVLGFAEEAEHVLFVGFDAGLVEGVDAEEGGGDCAGELEEVDEGAEGAGGEVGEVEGADVPSDVGVASGAVGL